MELDRIKKMYEEDFRKMSPDERVRFLHYGGRVVKRRNRISQKKDSPETVVKKMEGQRDALQKWGYGGKARQMNFLIGVCKLATQIIPNRSDTDLAQKKKELWDKIS